MCDYSLEHVASRPAEVGDRLTSTKFPHSLTGGFVAVGDPRVAVCLRPGTELAFDQDVIYSRGFSLIPLRFGRARVPHRVARFRELEPHRPNRHHDALEFPNGEIVLVTTLREGLTATVLQLPAEPKETRHEPGAVKREHSTAL